jgi:hypothetical protein
MPDTNPDSKRRLEVLAREKSTPAHLLAGAKALRRWDDSTEISEAELQAAIAEVQNIRIG